MQQKFNIAFAHFAYGGNGGISSETPDIREWQVPLVCELARDPRIGEIRVFNISDTPITMSRNQAVLKAREMGADVLVMVDSDMKPDMYAGHADAKPFIQSSFDFLVNHYPKGPVVIGAPYCGPPPVECVYVFRWQNMASENPNPDFQLEMYDRNTAAKMAGIQECAALPTGLIMFDMRCFDLIEPSDSKARSFAYYEWSDKYEAKKASTEDVTMTRDISLVGIQKLGYNPVFCNWDAWAGHWKPKCVGKPQVIAAEGISHKLKDCWEAKVESGVKLVEFKSSLKLPDPAEFDGMGMDLPGQDANALASMVAKFQKDHGRPPVVCEVGSWAGRSAITMAKAGAKEVVCVDTWEGSENDEGCKAYDGSRGTPLQVFLRNTQGLPIRAHCARSPEAAQKFKDGECDIVYIDAEHDYESVKADIEAWRPKAKHILAGHDYHSFPDVRRAVKDCGITPHVEGNVWMTSVGS